MAKGKLKRVANLDRKFGAASSYLFVKVQADYASDAEEYLLLTDDEFSDAAARGADNPEDTTGLRRGILTVRENAERRFGVGWLLLRCARSSRRPGEGATLLFTESGLERIRQRVEKNAEDIEANRESWLANLFD